MREPFIGMAQELLGDNAVVFKEPGMYLKTMNLVALSGFERESRSALENVLRGLVMAEEFYREHPEESLALVADKLHADVAQLGHLFDHVELEVTLSHALVVALEDEALWAAELTEGRDTPDFQRLISTDALRAIKSAAVTVID